MHGRKNMKIGQSHDLENLLIIGHANSFHDPSIAIIKGDEIYAEAFERHTQRKISIVRWFNH